jgi:hypothetical protein
MIAISEDYHLDGRPSGQNRRDMRSGPCTGYLGLPPPDLIHKGMSLRLEFEGQIGGKQLEYFYVVSSAYESFAKLIKNQIATG